MQMSGLIKYYNYDQVKYLFDRHVIFFILLSAKNFFGVVSSLLSEVQVGQLDASHPKLVTIGTICKK
jgi:hypothetical protein